MKRLMLCFCFAITCADCFSQQTVNVDKETNTGNRAIDLFYTVAGVPFVKAKFARLVEGTPFFKEEIMRGAIILSEGKEYKNLLVRLNLLDEQVNYIDEKQIELVATTPVKEVVLWDTINKMNYRFVYSEYIGATMKPEKGFYELLQAGKAELYKQYKKNMIETRPYGSATIEQSIQTYLSHFILLNGKWTRIKRLKDLPEILADRKKEVAQFIEEKKISRDSEESYITVIAYYNSLFIK